VVVLVRLVVATVVCSTHRLLAKTEPPEQAVVVEVGVFLVAATADQV
jgi:hypothetical protein